MTVLHSTMLSRDQSEREHQVAMGRDPACRGVITGTAHGTTKRPQTWVIYRCESCGHECTVKGVDHPRYGQPDEERWAA